MALNNAVQNATKRGQRIQWRTNEGPRDLTGATLTGRIRNKQTGVTQAIAGALTPEPGLNGWFTWAYALADVATVGYYEVQFIASFLDLQTDKTFVEGWEVTIAL
jgi:hypothetical protein